MQLCIKYNRVGNIQEVKIEPVEVVEDCVMIGANVGLLVVVVIGIKVGILDVFDVESPVLIGIPVNDQSLIRQQTLFENRNIPKSSLSSAISSNVNSALTIESYPSVLLINIQSD